VILFKKQLFDLEVKVQWRSLRYTTHRLMVMHPHTKYHWPISKDKQVMVRTSFAEKKQKKKIRLKQYVCLRWKGRHKYTWSWSQATILLYFICKSLSLAFYYVLYFFTTKYKTSSSSQTFFCYGWPQMKRVQSFIYFLYRNSRGLVQLIVWIEPIYCWKWH
jgi:hypothetical protein